MYVKLMSARPAISSSLITLGLLQIPRVRISIVSVLKYLLPPLINKHRVSTLKTNPRPVEEKAMAGIMDKAKGFLAEKVAHVKMPEASLKDVSVKRLERDGANFTGEVSVDNPYSHRLPICELKYILKSADRIVASGTMVDPGWIEASGPTNLEVPFKLPYDFLMSLLRDIGRDWDIDYVFEVGLTIDLPIVGNFTIPLCKKGELKLPSIGDFFSGGEGR